MVRHILTDLALAPSGRTRLAIGAAINGAGALLLLLHGAEYVAGSLAR